MLIRHSGIPGVELDPSMPFEELSKALSIGDSFPAAIGQSNPAQLMATVPQDLSDYVADNLEQQKHLLFQKDIAKETVHSTVHQFSRRTSRGGDHRVGGWHREGGRPGTRSTSYQLDEVKIRYAGASCSVSVQASTVKSIVGNVVANENDQAAMNILMALEHSLIYGNNATNPYNIDGICTQVRNRGGNVIDMRGAAPTEDMLDEGVVKVSDRGSLGSVTDIYCSPQMKKSLRRLYYERMRKDFGDQIKPNYTLKEIEFDHGPVEIKQSVFMSHEGQLARGAVGEDLARRPTTPVLAVQPAANNGPGSLFVAGDAGTYIYGAQFLNPFGESIVVTTSPVAVAAGQLVTFTLNDQGVGEQVATGIRLLRSDKNGDASTLREMAEVPTSGASNGNTVVTDRNEDIPGCQTVVGLTRLPKSISQIELLPMFNFPFGRVATSYEWANLLYIGLKVQIPEHHIIWRNVRPDKLAS